ncbi:MAG: AAA family ATPase [Prevotella sp.]
MKYPIGIQSFEQIIAGGYVYADKTAMIYKLVTEGKIYFLSRPRRFGKSLLVSTLENYFLGRKELFRGLAIDRLEKDWMEYPVFHLDFNGKVFTTPYELDNALESFVATGEGKYGKSPFATTLGDRLEYVFEQAYTQTGRRAVVLVDEYDKPLLDVMDTNQPAPVVQGEIKTLEDHNRNILKGFYSVFKSADKHLHFVLMTGVTKFSQVSVFSGFNQPKDISLDARYDALCGITKDEMLSIFHQPIVQLAEKYGVGEEEMVAMLKRKYDGYHFSESFVDIFNPFSILNTFDSMKFDDYWFKTGTPTYLMRLMKDCNENINELAGKYYPTAEFVDYKATNQKPLPMLYQSGYLTIKGYDMRRNTYLLDFPNEEVRSGTIALLSSDYFTDSAQPSSWLLDVTDALEAGDLPAFHLQLKSLLSGISYRFQRKENARECERYFQYTFYLIMQMLGKYSTYIEKETSQGRIDCVVECPDYVYIFEFKLNSTGRTAIKQIDAKGYAQPYAADPRKVYKVGISFSSKTGTVKDFVHREEKFGK